MTTITWLGRQLVRARGRDGLSKVENGTSRHDGHVCAVMKALFLRNVVKPLRVQEGQSLCFSTRPRVRGPAKAALQNVQDAGRTFSYATC